MHDLMLRFPGNLDAATGTGIFPSFVQIQNTGTEEGFNTDFRPKVEDTDNSAVHNHSIQLKDIPTTTIDGIVYREFRLDLNESKDVITLETLQIYKASVGNLSTLTGATQLYDMDGGADGKTGGATDVDVSVQLSAWATGASPVHLILLAIGGLATLILVLRLGQVAIKLGLVSRVPIDPGPTISGQIDLK